MLPKQVPYQAELCLDTWDFNGLAFSDAQSLRLRAGAPLGPKLFLSSQPMACASPRRPGDPTRKLGPAYSGSMIWLVIDAEGRYGAADPGADRAAEGPILPQALWCFVHHELGR